ncbi:MAG: SAM-dependent methyltransferase, partial [Gammaproteobacteria bacterium]|nr:SAM-dependent methyltransferase [Gammaproteobacteria bacterium]
MKKSDIQVLAEPGDEAKRRSGLLMQSVSRAGDRTCDQTCESTSSQAGWIRFSEFMNIALYEPGLGYYSGGLQKFGEKGDFITAPEVSPLFGQCLANQIAEVLENLAGSSAEDCFVIEFGAGSGVLAVDILLALESLDALPEKYLILELSAELQHRQKETIKKRVPHLYNSVQWLEQLPDVSNAVVIANEVLDAMPVECFRIADNNAIESLMVAVEEGNKLVTKYVTDENTAEKISSIQQRSEIELDQGYSSETNLALHGWLSALESKINKAVILLI